MQIIQNFVIDKTNFNHSNSNQDLSKKDWYEVRSDYCLYYLRLVVQQNIRLGSSRTDSSKIEAQYIHKTESQLSLRDRIVMAIFIVCLFPISMPTFFVGSLFCLKSTTLDQKVKAFEGAKKIATNYQTLDEKCFPLVTPGTKDGGFVVDEIHLSIPLLQKISPNLQLSSEEDLTQIFEIANTYTLNTPYHTGSGYVLDIDGVSIFRPNHNGTHSGRQVRLLEGVFDLITKRGSDRGKEVVDSLTQNQILNLKLGQYFLRAGRVDERSWSGGDDYYTRSALIYEAYAKQLGIPPEEIAWMKEQLLHSCKPIDNCPEDFKTDPKKNFVFHLLVLVHELDLIRVCDPEKFARDENGRKGENFKKIEHHLGSILKETDSSVVYQRSCELLDFSADLLRATGVEPYKFDTTPSGDGLLFKECSMGGGHCWSVLREKSFPKWSF